jgi:hypothetical protein
VTAASWAELVAASVDGRPRQVCAVFEADPDIARRSLLAATVLGEATEVRERIAADPGVAAGSAGRTESASDET